MRVRPPIRWDLPEICQQSWSIDNNVAGAMIGPEGQRINEIRNKSRAQIIIGDINDQGQRVLQVTGTRVQFDLAFNLLQKAVMDHLLVK